MRTLWIYSVLLLAAIIPAKGQSVVFSHPGGFYADTFCLNMQAVEGEEWEIHYTLNGNIPTECDALYTSPLPLTPNLYSLSNAYRIPNVPEDRWYEPPSVEKIIVVRAALFDSDGYRRSPVTTHSYIIDSLLGRHITLPVVSLCTDSLSLFDYDTGIFVKGYFFEPKYPYTTGNYFQKGQWWEREASFALYDSTGLAVQQDCGLRVHGNSQRVLAQKGFSLYARSDYGISRLVYPFFGEQGLPNFKRLTLRPWCASWSDAGIEDWLCQQLARPLRCDRLDSRPVVLFLNGEYWGIYFLEEKVDEYYIEGHYGINGRKVDLLSYWGGEVEHGSDERWWQLYEWLQHPETQADSSLQYLESHVDLDALLDYMLLQLLVANDDWPVNNTRFWSTDKSRWRWIFFDGDGALTTAAEDASILDYLTYASHRQSTHSSYRASLLFRRLLGDPSFLARSYERMSVLVDSHFSYPNTAPLLQDIVSQVASEVPYQSQRFGSPSSVGKWKTTISAIDGFLRTEPQAMLDKYANYFGLTEPESAFVAVYDRYGRLVLPPGSSEAQIKTLPRGIYFLRPDGRGEIKKKTIE